jgi:hypothetical protein
MNVGTSWRQDVQKVAHNIYKIVNVTYVGFVLAACLREQKTVLTWNATSDQEGLLPEVLLHLHREMAVDYLQVWITTAKELGPHNCPEKGRKKYTCRGT